MAPDRLTAIWIEDWVSAADATLTATRARYGLREVTLADVLGEASLTAFMAQRRALLAWCEENGKSRSERGALMGRPRPKFRDQRLFIERVRALLRAGHGSVDYGG